MRRIIWQMERMASGWMPNAAALCIRLNPIKRKHRPATKVYKNYSLGCTALIAAHSNQVGILLRTAAVDIHTTERTDNVVLRVAIVQLVLL